ncbi:MAG: alkaline phosphatase family protein, partial [Actinomycetota bacterium]
TAPDGKVLTEALELASVRKEPPKLIVTYVWDAAGTVVLDEWPKSWPYLKSLIPDGTWYDNSTIASAPASTAQIHAEMGTGAFPRNHGVVGHHYRIGNYHVSPWRGVPTMPILPTLADLYDRANGNEPKIALSGTVAIHLGMESHGSLWGGGDKDIAVLREPDGAVTLGVEGVQWRLTNNVAPFFQFPSYANELPGIETYFKETDIIDGKQDQKWRGHPLSLDDEQTLAGFETPARIPYQQKLVEEMIKREGLGKDSTPDMLFVNNKLIDTLAHIGQGLNSVEMSDAIETEDKYLERFVDFLNKEVGEGKWAMVLTADHGATPFPKASGAFVISPGKVASLIQNEFDKDDDDQPIIGGDAPTSGFVQPTQIFLNHEELAGNNVTVEEVAKFVMTLTKEQTYNSVPPSQADANEKVFPAAIPGDMLAGLPCLQAQGSGGQGTAEG